MQSTQSDSSEEQQNTQLTHNYPECPEQASFFTLGAPEIINLDEEETSQQRVARLLSERYSIEERIFLIVNKQTGEVYDSRNDTVIDNLLKESSMTLPSGVNVNSWDEYWKRVNHLKQDFVEAACKGNIKKMESLLKQQNENIPVDVNFKSFDNWTALHFAAFHCQVDVIDFLIKRKANVNAQTRFGWTALHISAKKSQLPSAYLLLEAQADPNIQDEQLYTPLHYAAQSGDKPMVELLLKFSANHKIKNVFGRSAKDCSINAEVINVFPTQNSNSYGKTVVNGVVIPNGRADHIQMLLQATKVDVCKKQNIQLPEKPNKKFINMFKMYKAFSQKEQLRPEDFNFYRRLGRGAFGEVWLAKKIKDPIDRYYAIKILNKDKIVGSPLERYIKTQKDVLSLVSHPFLVRLYYSFQNESKLFLVMQFCEGGDMGVLLNKKRKLAEDLTKKYVAQIILALEALHKNLIIYRDLKPDNLIIDKDGHVMITDFGLSKQTTDYDKMNTSFCGTPAYMPLQILDKKGHNRMADWYTLGVVVYEFLTGLPPFYANTRDQLFKNKRQHLLKLPRNVSEECKDFIKQLLQKDCNKRLGIQKDAQSLREHPWFKGFDWQKVYNRELQMPKPETTLILGNPIKMKFAPGKQIKNLPNWSYAV